VTESLAAGRLAPAARAQTLKARSRAEKNQFSIFNFQLKNSLTLQAKPVRSNENRLAMMPFHALLPQCCSDHYFFAHVEIWDVFAQRIPPQQLARQRNVSSSLFNFFVVLQLCE
jgi:hypothetical protein